MPLGVRSGKSSDCKSKPEQHKNGSVQAKVDNSGPDRVAPPGQSRPPSTFEDARAACAHVCLRASLRSEGPTGGVGCGVGGGVGGGGLNRLVGHDASGELLLGLLEAGAGGTIQRVHLGGNRGRTGRVPGPTAAGRRGDGSTRLTFLNIMSEQTERAVKSAAISSMMMPTGMLVLSPVSAAIQPLAIQTETE